LSDQGERLWFNIKYLTKHAVSILFFNIYTVSQKTRHPTVSIIIRQILADFQNSSTAGKPVKHG